MSNVPLINEIGDRLEAAILEDQESRRRAPIAVLLAASFFAVLVIVAVAPLVLGGSDSPPATGPTTTTSTITTEAADLTGTPADWSRGLDIDPPDIASRMILSDVVATSDGFAAVGYLATTPAEAASVIESGAVYTSRDGKEWEATSFADGVALFGLAEVDGDILAIGVSGNLPIVFDGRNGSMTELPVGTFEGEVSYLPRAIEGTPAGLIVVGQASRTTGTGTSAVFEQRVVVWRGDEGGDFELVEGAAFGWHEEADAAGVASDDDRTVAVGIVSDGGGSSVPAVWTTTDGSDWTMDELPASSDSIGFSGASGVAHGHDRFLAVGFAPSSSGRSPAAWTSSDGLNWTITGQGDALTRGGTDAGWSTMYDVAATADGFVAIGVSTSDIGVNRSAHWTTDRSATSWNRYDLHGDRRIASAIATGSDAVVAVGYATSLSATTGSGATWIGPAPDGWMVVHPLEPTSEAEHADVPGWVYPSEAVATSKLTVEVSRSHGNIGDAIWFVSDTGEAHEVCDAIARTGSVGCVVLMDDWAEPLREGTYGIAVGAPENVVIEEALTILPTDSEVVTFDVLWSRWLWPQVHAVYVGNRGAHPLDLSGWTISNTANSRHEFVFPDETELPPKARFTLDFAGAHNQRCREMTPTYVHWCHVVSDGETIDYFDEDLLWQGGSMQLTDARGVLRGEWTP